MNKPIEMSILLDHLTIEDISEYDKEVKTKIYEIAEREKCEIMTLAPVDENRTLIYGDKKKLFNFLYVICNDYDILLV